MTLTKDAALEMVRDLAKDSSNVVPQKPHCEEKMLKRRVTLRQVIECVRRGTITEGPFRNPKGNWQVNMTRHGAGEELTCTVAIIWAKRLLVITVMPGRRK
jgi:hypothetical protein